MNNSNYVVTISRQIGSEGISVGQRISEHFGFEYVDRQLLVQAAERLNVSEEQLQVIDEKSFSIWGSFLQSSVYDSPYMPAEYYLPTGRQLFETQSEIITKAVEESSCVVVGRCGTHIFREHEKHISIFLYADKEYRQANVEKIWDLSPADAKKKVEKEDKERARYYNAYTANQWKDASQYSICIDIGKLGLDDTVNLLIDYINKRFPEMAK